MIVMIEKLYSGLMVMMLNWFLIYLLEVVHVVRIVAHIAVADSIHKERKNLSLFDMTQMYVN